MNIITLDFETYFDSEYTLSKMTTEAYVRDARFEVLCVSIRWNEYPDADCNQTLCYDYSDAAAMLRSIDWSTTVCLCHHAAFDGLILSHHYGITPAGWLDTYSMAKLLLGNHVKVGLDKLATHYGLQNKTVPYNEFRGLHWAQMGPFLQRRLMAGCDHDTNLTWTIFCILAREFPAEEYGVVDMTIRMFTEPKIIGDTELLAEVWIDETVARQELLARLNVTTQQLRSDESFTELLAELGVEPEWKQGKSGPIPAFAKSDEFMQELLDDADDNVRALAEARLQSKSTLPLTRAERLGWMSTRGAMCVYLHYCGAHTTRDSGGDKVNYQNFQRADPAHPKRARIRRAHMAPKGKLVGVIDASQIECRFLNEFSGQWDIVQKFRDGIDLYSDLATQFYGFPVSKANPAERGTGKQLELSCGYGAGGHTIVLTARKGTYGPPVHLTENQGEDAKNLYRSTHQQVVGAWKQAGEWLKLMGAWQSGEWGPLRIECDEARGRRRIILPNDAPLIYDTLEWHNVTDIHREHMKGLKEWQTAFWRYKTRKGWRTIYGAALIENLIQALARVFVFQAALKLRKEGIWIWSRSHDELALLINDDQYAQATLEWCLEQMRTPPAWMPNVPLNAEGLLGERYEK